MNGASTNLDREAYYCPVPLCRTPIDALLVDRRRLVAKTDRYDVVVLSPTLGRSSGKGPDLSWGRALPLPQNRRRLLPVPTVRCDAWVHGDR